MSFENTKTCSVSFRDSDAYLDPRIGLDPIRLPWETALIPNLPHSTTLIVNHSFMPPYPKRYERTHP